MISIIITSILAIIGIYIELTRFLKIGTFEIIFNIDRKILKWLNIIKKPCAKLILGRYMSLNYGNYCKLQIVYIANNKNKIIDIKKRSKS